jgi:hypothetical protein
MDGHREALYSGHDKGRKYLQNFIGRADSIPNAVKFFLYDMLVEDAFQCGDLEACRDAVTKALSYMPVAREEAAQGFRGYMLSIRLFERGIAMAIAATAADRTGPRSQTPAASAIAMRRRLKPTPGSVAVESDSVAVSALANPVGANDASEDGRQLKLMNAVAFGLPEYMLSDGSNANLASSTSQQLPALMTFADMQRTLIEELWRPLFKLVIREAVAAGRLPEQVARCDADGEPAEDGEMIDAVDAFDVSYTPLQDNNIQALATALEIAARNGWVDDETATTEMGFDWGIVSKRLKQQKESAASDMATGMMPEPPGYIPPGMEDAAAEVDDEDEDEADGLQPGTTGATAQTRADRPRPAA